MKARLRSLSTGWVKVQTPMACRSVDRPRRSCGQSVRLRLAVACALLSLLAVAPHCARALPPEALLFDDFSHANVSALQHFGWTLRTAPGHPGVARAHWNADAVTMEADLAQTGNQLLRLRAWTNGSPDGTVQAQVCHERKYREGTYAARVRFTDAPERGQDGDIVVQAFYTVSPLRFDLDPDFSEVDWEYLPNGGWGDSRTRLYAISWQTVRLQPWQAHNQAHQEWRSLNGWHVLQMQVLDGRTRHWLDGHELANHGGRSYPAVPMSINFNHWFPEGGLLPVSEQRRTYVLDVDWVLHIAGQALSPAQVINRVQSLRRQGVSAQDTVATASPPLASACDF